MRFPNTQILIHTQTHTHTKSHTHKHQRSYSRTHAHITNNKIVVNQHTQSLSPNNSTVRTHPPAYTPRQHSTQQGLHIHLHTHTHIPLTHIHPNKPTHTHIQNTPHPHHLPSHDMPVCSTSPGNNETPSE
eukprot:GHVQ01009186.1.p1 GENE.GHVQ01009186.1~~GHVQ01009186.1.p1  ORF type:complete len:147 (-),score=32.13 GHVQ01009186.1:311-700(-)